MSRARGMVMPKEYVASWPRPKLMPWGRGKGVAVGEPSGHLWAACTAGPAATTAAQPGGLQATSASNPNLDLHTVAGCYTASSCSAHPPRPPHALTESAGT